MARRSQPPTCWDISRTGCALVRPCHRVLGNNGLGGFMKRRGGFPLEIKRWLLKHERAEPQMNADGKTSRSPFHDVKI